MKKKLRLAENHAHQQSLFDPARARPVVVIGAGMISGAATFALAKMGVSDITVIDHDSVDSYNGPMSVYGPKDIGRYKVDALKRFIKDRTGIVIKTERRKYNGEPLSRASVVCSVDDMDTRKQIWQAVKENPTIDLLCDTRTTQWFLEVLSTAPGVPEECKDYEALLFSNSKAARQVCGRHGHISVAFAGGMAVASTLTTFWQGGTKKWRHAMRCDTLETIY